MAQIAASVTGAPLDIAGEIARASIGGGASGAVVTFTGLCRDEGGQLEKLELEHYPGMAETELARIATVAATRFSLDMAAIVHRFGVVRPGEPIVLVVTAAPHRHAAFEAAAFIMDFLKTDAPFWKKEHWKDGDTKWQEGSGSSDQ